MRTHRSTPIPELVRREISDHTDRAMPLHEQDGQQHKRARSASSALVRRFAGYEPNVVEALQLSPRGPLPAVATSPTISVSPFDGMVRQATSMVQRLAGEVSLQMETVANDTRTFRERHGQVLDHIKRSLSLQSVSPRSSTREDYLRSELRASHHRCELFQYELKEAENRADSYSTSMVQLQQAARGYHNSIVNAAREWQSEEQLSLASVLKLQTDEVRSEYASYDAEMKEALCERDHTVRVLHGELGELTGHYNLAESQVEEAYGNLSIRDSHIVELQEERRQAENRLRSEQQQLVAAGAQLESLAIETEAVTSQMRNTTAHLDESREMNTEMEEKERVLRSEVQQQHLQLNALMSSAQDAQLRTELHVPSSVRE